MSDSMTGLEVVSDSEKKGASSTTKFPSANVRERFKVILSKDFFSCNTYLAIKS